MLNFMRMLFLPKGENNYMDIKDGNPLFTIIVAVLNNKEFLERCIESVNNQTYPHKELIIIDGGSTDGTVDILKDNDDRIAYWESKTDCGIYHAWNKALDHAHGECICFAGADDYFYNLQTLENIVPHLPANVIIRAIAKSIKYLAANARSWEVKVKMILPD
jgi:glycosyltransferase involved in cell wall biosynthesis